MTAKKAEKVVLEADLRAVLGKERCGRLRREGLVPAVVYGEGELTTPIQVLARDLTKALHTKAGENVLITLRFKVHGNAKKESAVLIKQMQHHPVSQQVTHVDFHYVSLTKKITVTVPFVFKGDAVGVRQEGGFLEHIRWEVEVECLPTEIPLEIPVDVSALALGQTLYAKQVLLPAGVILRMDPEQPVAACVMPKVEEIPASPVEGEPQAAEPEVLKQKKPEEIAAQEEAKAKEKQEKPEKSEKKQEPKKEEKK